MSRLKLSVPHVRRKAQLKSTQLHLKVKIADAKEKLANVTNELKAMSPPPKKE